LLIEHRSPSGWLGPFGRIRAWPRPDGGKHHGVGVSFVLSLPREFERRVLLHVGKTVFVVRPGESFRVRCAAASGPVNRTFFTPDITVTPDLVELSVRMTQIRILDKASSTGCARARTGSISVFAKGQSSPQGRRPPRDEGEPALE
jgi:hypothetical protein